MKYLKYLIILIFVFSCNSNDNSSENTQNTKVQVSVTTIKEGYLPDLIEVLGKTLYLNKNTIIAPISGYIIQVNVKEGDRVSKGKVMFEMQAPEAYILQQNDSLKSDFGRIKIYSPTSGIVSGLNVVQKGVFSDQGSQLCLIIASGELKVQAEIPYEYRKYSTIGKKCTVLFPDGNTIETAFSKILPQMNNQNQTMNVLADINPNFFVPENMIVKLKFDKSEKHSAQIIPKTCLMTDALMKEFWVMKLINDSVAVRINVSVGNQTQKQVEILSPKFKSTDRIIVEGAYGLDDTVNVKINN